MAMAPRSFLELRALFLWSRRKASRDVGARGEALPAERRRDAARRARGARVGVRDARLDGRPEVLRPARHVAAHDAAAAGVRRVRLRRGARLRRLLDPRLAGDLRVGHAARARSDDARSSTPPPRRRRSRSSARSSTRSRGSRTRATRAGSRKRAEEYLRSTGIADTCFFGPECEFFVFDEVSYELGAERGALLGRLGRGLLELRQAGARLHVAAEGGLLPDGAARLAPRPAHRDGADARAPRHPVRVPPPRGRLGRPVRDRPPLPDADPHGRPGHDLQVRRQERRPRARQVGDVHAEADLRRQRLRACTATSPSGRRGRR